jgi:hypothetical protein
MSHRTPSGLTGLAIGLQAAAERRLLVMVVNVVVMMMSGGDVTGSRSNDGFGIHVGLPTSGR